MAVSGGQQRHRGSNRSGRRVPAVLCATNLAKQERWEDESYLARMLFSALVSPIPGLLFLKPGVALCATLRAPSMGFRSRPRDCNPSRARETEV